MIKKLSLRQKVILAFMCFAIIPALLVGFLSMHIAQKNVVNMRREEYQRQFNNTRSLVNQNVDRVNLKILEIYKDDQVQSNLGKEIKAEDRLALFNHLRSYCREDSFEEYGIEMMGIYGNHGFTYITNYDLSELLPSIESIDAFLRENNINTVDSWLFKEIDNEDEKPARLALINIKKVRDIDTLEEYGYIVTVLNDSFVTNIMHEPLPGGANLLVGLDGRILYPRSGFNGTKTLNIEEIIKNKDANSQTILGEKYLVSYSKLNNLHCYLVNCVPSETILASTHEIVYVTVGIIILAIIISIVAAPFASKLFMGKINRLIDVMEEASKGNLQARYIATGKDEIDKAGASLNRMIESLDNQIKETQTMNESRLESERKLLQAQMNPHLIYNTMNSLKNLAYEKDYKKLSFAIDQLSAFYRASLGGGKQVVTVSEEIKLVEAYISLQQVCFDSKIQCLINISDEALKNVIPKMTLQPIVENAIVHGLAAYNMEGVIEINSIIENESLTICISDSGVGIEKSILDKLNSMFNDGETISKDAFGLSNINSRIRYAFGKEYGLVAEGILLEYTKMKVILPLITEEEWDAKSNNN